MAAIESYGLMPLGGTHADRKTSGSRAASMMRRVAFMGIAAPAVQEGCQGNCSGQAQPGCANMGYQSCVWCCYFSCSSCQAFHGSCVQCGPEV
jgi:hypothetical protein